SVAFDPGHVSVTVKGNPVRAKRFCFFDSIGHAFEVLKRQPEDEIVPYRFIPDFARPKRYPGYVVKGLNSVNGFLHFFGIILYAETHAPEPQIVELLQMLPRRVVGMTFETE